MSHLDFGKRFDMIMAQILQLKDTKTQEKKTGKYCHSHGYGNHLLIECKEPKLGHQKLETKHTKENKGSTFVYRRFRK